MAEAKVSRSVPAHLVQLTVGGASEPWHRIGVSFDTRGGCRIGQVTLHLDDQSSVGHCSWAFDPEVSVIDGVPSASRVPAGEVVSTTYCLVDHVVVMTDSLERTSSMIESAAGLALRKTRDASGGVRQAFHRSGEVVIEVVEAPNITEPHLWGFVLVAPEFDRVLGELGESVVSAARAAVQPGRRIATVRREVGLGVHVALMSADQ